MPRGVRGAAMVEFSDGVGWFMQRGKHFHATFKMFTTP
jgi:hypothetical protein